MRSVRAARWNIGAGALLCLLTLFLGGCHAIDSNDSARRTTVRFWAMGREGEIVAELIPDFERSHPDIHIELQQLPWTAAHEKLLTAFAGDALPDICQLGNTWVPEFSALAALEPLDPFVATSKSIAADDYFSGIWDTNIIAGQLLGIPWYADTRLLFYRKDMLAEAGFTAPPTDWDEWRRMMIAIKTRAGSDGYSILLPLDEFEPLLQFAIQQDDPLLRDDGTRGNFESRLPARLRFLHRHVCQVVGAEDERHDDLECLE